MVGFAWLGSALGWLSFPSSARAERVREEADAAIKAAQFDRAIALANEGLRWAPLNWQFYFQRALAELYSYPSTYAAIVDFNRARFLEPNAIQVPYDEARAWLQREPRLAFSAWVDTLRRAGDRKVEYFRDILRQAKGVSQVEDELFSLPINDPELLVVFLDFTSKEEFAIELEKLLLDDPGLKTLKPEQQQQLFASWADKGDARALEERLDQHPEWLPNAWLALARIRARNGDLQKACELAQQYAPKPKLPSFTSQKKEEDLRRSLQLSSDDFASGYALFEQHALSNDTEVALSVLNRMTRHTNCPTYFYYLEGTLLGVTKDWQSAWNAWDKYMRQTAP
jgi:hypothetical protein